VLISEKEVKHIKIHQNQNGSFYLDLNEMFQSLEMLVEHYKNNSLRSGNCLTHPCARVRKTINKKKSKMQKVINVITHVISNLYDYILVIFGIFMDKRLLLIYDRIPLLSRLFSMNHLIWFTKLV